MGDGTRMRALRLDGDVTLDEREEMMQLGAPLVPPRSSTPSSVHSEPFVRQAAAAGGSDGIAADEGCETFGGVRMHTALGTSSSRSVWRSPMPTVRWDALGPASPESDNDA